MKVVGICIPGFADEIDKAVQVGFGVLAGTFEALLINILSVLDIELDI